MLTQTPSRWISLTTTRQQKSDNQNQYKKTHNLMKREERLINYNIFIFCLFFWGLGRLTYSPQATEGSFAQGWASVGEPDPGEEGPAGGALWTEVSGTEPCAVHAGTYSKPLADRRPWAALCQRRTPICSGSRSLATSSLRHAASTRSNLWCLTWLPGGGGGEQQCPHPRHHREAPQGEEGNTQQNEGRGQ